MKSIRQTATFRASVKAVYEALMDSRKHSRFSGRKAKVSKKVGGKFSVYGGSLVGTNLQLVKNKKIVQAWRCKMKDWPKNHYSKATFSLKKVKDGTRLSFFQSGVPNKCHKMISKGWKDYYWTPMKKML